MVSKIWPELHVLRQFILHYQEYIPIDSGYNIKEHMKFNVDISKEDFYHLNQFAAARINQSPAIKWKIAVYNITYWCLLTLFILEIYSLYGKGCCFNYRHLNIALMVLAIWFVFTLLWQHIYLRLYLSSGQ